jgi:membrane protease YdiL (CAAX protease family)
MRNLVRNNRLAAYFTLAFLWSWSWWIGLILSTPSDAFMSGNLPPTFFVFALIGGFGPSISGIMISLITGGKKETGSLLSGIKKGKFGVGWWAAAILTVPLITLAQTGLHVISGRIVTYDVPGLMMIMGFIWPLFSSFGEERGFALPKMQKRFGVLSSSLLLGVIWGLWHLPSDYIAYSSYGWLFIPIFLLLGPVTLTAHSVIMTFIYNKTKGSLIPMILYHYTITMAGILSPSFSFSGHSDDIAKVAVSAGVIVLAAVLVIIFSKTMRNKQPDWQNDRALAAD